MQEWRVAVDQFLARWRAMSEVTGALVCGSFVTGGATSESDIDLRILLEAGSKWSERGNRVVGGYLIEYFAGSADKVRSEFRDDHKVNSWMSMVQFTTGEILFDTSGDIAVLRQEAAQLMSRPFIRLDDAETSIGMRYAMWDTLDNLRDSAIRNAPDFSYVYHHAIADTFKMYARYLGWHLSGSHQHYRLLCDDAFRTKYTIPPFPDSTFRQLFGAAFRASDLPAMLAAAERVIEHTIDQMGGFKIDGWVQRETSIV